MELKKAILVLADISGYTRFLKLHTMSLLHAEKIVTELMDSIIHATRAPLKLNKLQGDAILFYAETGEQQQEEAAKEIVRQVDDFFEAFRSRSMELTGCNNMCPCDACSQADQLRLKAILHNGEIAVKQVHGFEELAGEPVITAHRLLKNSVGSNEYILMTKSFAALSGGFKEKDTMAGKETYEDVGEIEFEVYVPESDHEPADDKRSICKRIANAWRLDLYSLLRVLRLKAAPPAAMGKTDSKELSFWAFARDGFQGLAMLFGRKE